MCSWPRKSAAIRITNGVIAKVRLPHPRLRRQKSTVHGLASPVQALVVRLTGAANESGPIFDYSHGVALDGSPDIASQMGLDSLAGKAVIGGYVYRGTKMPGLNGTYFFADLLGTNGATGSNIGDNNKAQIASINYNNSTGVVTNLIDWTNQLNPGTSSTNSAV